MRYLHILEINSLSVALFANIFSHSMGCLFISFMASFDVLKFLSLLIRSYLFIFVFIFTSLGGRSKKDIATIYIKECSAYIFLVKFYSIQSYI